MKNNFFQKKHYLCKAKKTYMKKQYILLMLLLLASLSVYAQSGIYGVVKDEDTGELLVGAASRAAFD